MALETTQNYPVYFAITEDNTVARWRPFLQYVMAIPHLFIGAILSSAAGFCQIIMWFAIMFTAKMPPGLANFTIMAQRYNARAQSFALGLTEQYPPFEFASTAADPGGYAIRLDVNPAYENRSRLTVFFRVFMVIPIAIFWTIISIASALVGIVAWFAVVITGAYPVGMRNFVAKASRLGQRVTAYSGLLTDQYPPFALE